MRTLLKNITVLCALTQAEERESMQALLHREVGRLYCAGTFQQALEYCKCEPVDIVICDMELDGESGIDLIRDALDRDPETGIIVISDRKSTDALFEALNMGVDRFIIRPFQKPLLMESLMHCAMFIRDGTTGLPKRSRMQKSVAIECTKIMLLCDVDNFNSINNAYGYQFGDEAIKSIADFLNEFKPEHSTVYRMMDNTFAILMFDDDVRKAEEFATIINVLAYNSPVYVKGVGINVTFTIGISEGMDEDILTTANLALQEAKKYSRTQFHVYQADSTFESVQKNNLRWMNRVKTALEEGAITAWYQPIVNNRTGTIEKFECLVRLVDEDNSHISPDVFLEPAKLVGLMPNISFAVINQSFRCFAGNTYEFSINISEEDLKSGQFVPYILNRCEHYGVDPRRVVIEILESIGSHKSGYIIDQIMKLKEAGFQLALDDFGSESSNFCRLFELQVDYIKIDGQFIKEIASDHQSYQITEAITRFAQGIGAKVIAEYVCDEKVFNAVQGLGIDYSQGYYFGAAMPELPDDEKGFAHTGKGRV